MHLNRRGEASERGRAGELYIKQFLEEELSETGLTVVIRTEGDPNAPFDIEVRKGDEIRVGIENKDLSTTTQGTWIKGLAMRRKLVYAREHHIPKVLTTATMRDAGRIGFCRGLANSHVMRYDFDRDHLLQEIREACA